MAESDAEPGVIWLFAKAISVVVLVVEMRFAGSDVWGACTYESEINKLFHSHLSLHLNKMFYSLHFSDVFRIHFCRFLSFFFFSSLIEKRFQLAAVPLSPRL